MTANSPTDTNAVVVVVNDDPAQIQELSNLLTRDGLDVLAFQSAVAALEGMDRNAPPSLIITDICMPGIDGWRFCRLLRSPDYAPFNRVPILVVSDTFAGEEPARIAAGLDANAFLASPVNEQEFGERVRMLLRGEQPRVFLRVLIVEDEEAQAKLLKAAFNTHGYLADTALTGREAETRFSTEAYDVVILDHHLPDIQGDKLLAVLKRQRPDAVYLAMTGDARPELALEWMRQGAAAFVSKPYSPQYLIELCAKARRERDLLRVVDRLETRTRELRESEEKHRILIEESADPIFSFTAEGRYLFVNRAFAQGVGKPVNQIVGRKIWDVFPREEADRRFAALNHVFTTGEEKVIEIRVPRAEGDRFYITTITPIKDAQGKVLTVICSSKDITKRKQTEEENQKLEAQNRQLQKAESLSRMAGAIAHKFNNQLQVVMGNLELAKDDLPRGLDVSEYLTEALQEARKASELSGLMLTYLGQTSGKHETLDLSEACRQGLPMLQAILPKDVDLETDLPCPGPAIKANARQIQQVLTNLTTNALEAFGKGGGVIRVAVKTVSLADIPVARHFPLDWQPRDNLYACLEVRDAGCGIAQKDIEKIFDPFFTTKFTGRGLGLSVVLGIARAHRGGITVESETGCGSVLRFFLPVAAEAVPRPPEKPDEALEFEQGGTMLLVEDEPSVRKAAKFGIGRLGFTVIEAKDGFEAVEVFRRHKDAIRFVLCDLTMPRMNGWETLAALRQLAPGIPVILASGYDQDSVMAGDHPERPNAFLGKPYELTKLRDAIRHALQNNKREGMKGQI